MASSSSGSSPFSSSTSSLFGAIHAGSSPITPSLLSLALSQPSSSAQQHQQQQAQQAPLPSPSSFNPVMQPPSSSLVSRPYPSPFPFKRFNRVNLRFKIAFYTQWGQNLMVCGSDLLFGKWSVKQGVWMTPHHEGELLVWQAVISVPERFELEYKYCMVDERLNVIKWESSGVRKFCLPEGLPDGSVVDVLDTWQDGSSPETLLARDAFKKVIFRKGASGRSGPEAEEEHAGKDEEGDELTPLPPLPHQLFELKDSVIVRFRVNCSRLDKGQKVMLSGSASVLGRWDPHKGLVLTHTAESTWEVDVSISRDDFPIRYKYALRDADGQYVPEYGSDIELGLDSSARKPSVMILVSDGHFRATPWRGAGVAIPVFSIRSADSVGVGEFSDLKLLVDFSVKVGFRLIQILPINDTSVHGMWWDSYPYSSLSVFALHPLYLRLQSLSPRLPQSIIDEINMSRKLLNPLKEVNYEATMQTKLKIARKAFELEKETVLASADFQKFFAENKNWLQPFAAFCFLKDLFGTGDHSQWGLFSTFSAQKVERLVLPTNNFYPSIAFVYYLQYHLHLQLLDASDYARQNRVVLKGDLPIGVDRWSVDTWQYPSLFHMDTSTGAPPDSFSTNGQNWGFPTYNWEEMSRDNYSWWRARLGQMAKYFTAYRIDHILGFFRIWELPSHAVSGICGHFLPSIPISAEEMEKEGVWDFNRLSEPYIRCHILQDIFGDRWSEVASKYLDEYEHLCFRFKEEVNTEKKVDEVVRAREGSPEWLEQETEETRKGLLSLHQNVVLLRDSADPRKFYPRFDCEKTSSFEELDDHSKGVIKRLYLDYYYSRQEALWRANAQKTLPVLMGCSPMLACGEDLGLVPSCVPPVLAELGLLGLRIQRMPITLGQDFANPSDYDYMTVCAPSCHDTSTLRAWWEEDADRRHNFFRTILGYSAPAPDRCTPDVTKAVILQHCDSPSVWAIFPLQDLMALREEYTTRPAKEETINDPSNPKHYWRFRVHVGMEDLIKDSDLVSIIQELLLVSGRVTPSDLPPDHVPSAAAFLASHIGSMSLARAAVASSSSPPSSSPFSSA